MGERSDLLRDWTRQLEELENILEKKGDEFYAQAEAIRPYEWIEPKSLLTSAGVIAKSLAFHHFTERMILEVLDAFAQEDEEKLERVRGEVREQFTKHETGLKWLERFQKHTPDTEKVD